MTDYKPKLIEVALPLAEINAAAAKEKSIRHGHPSMLHLWWARRPLAAARAVIWASLVDDPSGDDTLTEGEQRVERERLFDILKRLVKWENSNNPAVLADARAEIERCFPDGPPPILDPFAGGGAIPLEAQRLGLQALAGDLNPVAVLIQKAMLEVPPKFAGMSPIHPDLQGTRTSWERAQGLAADVEAYGRWLLERSHQRIGDLYPAVVRSDGKALDPIAWIWARTVKSPDPSWSGHVPLVSSWIVSDRRGKKRTWITPHVDRDGQIVSYKVSSDGEIPQPTIVRGNGVCIATGAAISNNYIREAGMSGQFGSQLLAIVAMDDGNRIYVDAQESQASAALKCPLPTVLPMGQMSTHPQYMGTPRYGLDEWWKLFTPRQLTALEAFSDLLPEVWSRVKNDSVQNGRPGDQLRLRDGGSGPMAYADAVVTYLAFVIDKCADRGSTIAIWDSSKETMGNTFGRQALRMTWSFTEAYPFSTSTGSFASQLSGVANAIRRLPAGNMADVAQRDARDRVRGLRDVAVSTDPPYYDNVPYSDISDFFYVWLRRNAAEIWPDECATVLTPKRMELVADSQRLGSREEAQEYFEEGMKNVIEEIRASQADCVPATIYYAYKSTEAHGVTGWSTFLQGILSAGFQITATWPLRTELANRLRGRGFNALASSIVLACRPRPETARSASRAGFITALASELPEAIRVLQSGGIAPVDLAQSSIGPGMKVFTRFANVVEADGSDMTVTTALSLINDALGEVLDGEGAELDRDTRFAIRWYEQHCFKPGPSGDADSQARATDTSLPGLASSGIADTRRGKFWLRHRSDLDPTWNPNSDQRLTAWEALQHLIAALEVSESQAAVLLHQLGGFAEDARQLAYILFQKATDNGWADEAGAYNGLITAWQDLLVMRLDDDGQGSLPVNDNDL